MAGRCVASLLPVPFVMSQDEANIPEALSEKWSVRKYIRDGLESFPELLIWAGNADLCQ